MLIYKRQKQRDKNMILKKITMVQTIKNEIDIEPLV